MQIVTRKEQSGHAVHPSTLDDTVFDGEAIPREISARAWLKEGVVHKSAILTNALESTRFLCGPQVSLTRDDIRRTTWAGVVEANRLLLCEVSGQRPKGFPAPRFDRVQVAEGDIWRYHLTLNKFTGKVSMLWVTRAMGTHHLWLDGIEVKTTAKTVDFPFMAFSQAAVGRIQQDEPDFAIMTYKCRDTGRLFWRRISNGEVGREAFLEVGQTVGGASIGIAKEKVVIRVDELRSGKLVPTLVESDDGGKSFKKARALDLSGFERGFDVVPGCTAPTIDKGYGINIPVFASNGKESVALNYVIARNMLVEAIRVNGARPKGSLEVFPSTLGSHQPYGNGVSDGHGLIMVLMTDGALYSSNSSAGGIHFPESAHLNREMPKIAAFDASECYSSGLHPNYVSMDYLYVEGDDRGRPISPVLHFETWDMPLPVPKVTANSKGREVMVDVLNDADLESGKVVFSFDDPSINIVEVNVLDMRRAIVKTDSADLHGKTISFDVQTLFHRHYGEALINEE